MTLDLAPVRHRRETLREQNLRIELAEARRDALTVCDVVEARLRALEPATLEIGPAAHQLCAGALVAVQRYRARVEK